MKEVLILQCDEIADPVALEAIRHLGELVSKGMVKPFWQAHAHGAVGRAATATCWTNAEPSEVDLLTALSGVASPSRIRLATIATHALPANSVASLGRRAEDLVEILTESQPAGVPFTDVRLIAPMDLAEPTPLTGLFSAHAAANIVLFPEDRMSDAGFGLPMAAAEPATFALHVAIEVATQAGLWHDMGTAPVDEAAPGLMSGDVRVWIARSYARIAVAPPLPVERAIAASDVLPVPPGIEPAPIPHQTAAEYANQLFDKFDELHFHESERFEANRTRLPLGSAFRLAGREAGAYIRNLPYQFRHGAAADLSFAAGEALTAALGGSSAVEVVWEGKVADDTGEAPSPLDVDELRGRLLDRLRRPESSAFDQNIWSSLVDDIFAMVDGGATSDGTVPPAVGTDRVAVVDPRAVAPAPEGDDLAAEVRRINDEALDSANPTVVGRMSARIRSEIGRSDSYVDGLLETITRQLDQLRTRRTRRFALLAWLAGVLFAGLAGALTVFSGLAEAVGVDSWSFDTRMRLLQWGFALLVATLGTILVVGIRSSGSRRLAFGIFVALVVLGGSVSLSAWETTLSLPEPFGTIRLGELSLVLTIALLFVVVLVSCAVQHTERGRAAARLTGVLAILIATVSAVIIVTRAGGWVARVSDEEFRSTGRRWIVMLTLVLLLVLVVTLILRVRERLTVDRLSAGIRWAARAAESAVNERARLAQALRQWHGSALAVARTVWSPFGRVDESRKSVVSEVGVEGEIRKLQLYLHEPHDEDLLGVMSRIRHEVADPGWLRRQHQVAVDAFQPRYAFRTGRALDPGTVRRPESDPAPEDPSLGADLPGQGIRWMFADMLFRGSFDDDLRSVGSELALDAVIEMYLARNDSARGVDTDMESFGGALVAGEAPSLPVHLFAELGLPVAGDPRAQFSTAIWWPRGITHPRTNRPLEIHETTVSTDSPTGLVVSFVRSDWSAAMPLSLLPFAGSSSGATNLEPAGRATRRVEESSDVM